MNETEASPYLTAVEVADHLKISERFVRELIREGRLKVTRFGRLVRIHRDDLDAYIARGRA